MIDAQFQRAMNARLQVFLVGAGDVLRGDILPLVLVAHATAGDHGDIQPGPAKTTIFHAAKIERVGITGKPGGSGITIRPRFQPNHLASPA